MHHSFNFIILVYYLDVMSFNFSIFFCTHFFAQNFSSKKDKHQNSIELGYQVIEGKKKILPKGLRTKFQIFYHTRLWR
jgi:hypothetical protein